MRILTLGFIRNNCCLSIARVYFNWKQFTDLKNMYMYLYRELEPRSLKYSSNAEPLPLSYIFKKNKGTHTVSKKLR